MNKLLFASGAALLAFATPSIAKPGNGHGQGQGHGNSAMHSQAGGYDDHHRGSYYDYGQRGCPPGLAKKNNGCLPPGHARKLYSRGQRYPGNYGALWNYNQIPLDLRSRYNFDRSNRYYYSDGYLYQVDPRTRMIEQVVSAIVR